MIPLKGILFATAALFCCASCAENKNPPASSNNRKTRELFSIGDANVESYNSNVPTIVNSYLQGEIDLSRYQNFIGDSFIQGYDAGSLYSEQPLYGYQYPVESIKRYAVKEDVDEGYVTTTRPVYLPRSTPNTPAPSSDGWRPILTNTPRPESGRSVFLQNIQVPNQIQHPIQPQPSVKTTYVPVEKVVGIPVPDPYTVPVYQPYPVAVPQPYPVKIPLPVQVESTVPVPVEKPVPVPVVKHVPYNVVKNEHVPIPLPYPVPVPLYKTKYVVHAKKK